MNKKNALLCHENTLKYINEKMRAITITVEDEKSLMIKLTVLSA